MSAAESSDIHRRGAEDAEEPQRELTEKIIGAAVEVHRHLGPGLLESVYQEALKAELDLRGLAVEAQRLVPVVYKGRTLANALRLDMVVAGAVIVEIKAVQGLEPIHQAQLLTYLRLTGLTAGLLLNFNEETLRQGIKRVSNSLRPSASLCALCASAVKDLE
jgi:GxxExxY protein